MIFLNLALHNKSILLISPQAWGKMFLTKHHYAIELARLGNRVFFLNPPDNINWSWKSVSSRISITPIENFKNLYLIQHQLFFPYLLKFHARWLFDILMSKHLAELSKKIGEKIDIVWSFDHSNIFPLSFFKNSYKIYHPVDESAQSQSYKAIESADIMFTVTKEILNKYKSYNIPKYLISHGVADIFVDIDIPANSKLTDNVNVGLSGNWLRPDLDHSCLIRIISENECVLFNFFGSYFLADTNLGGGHESHNEFISKLQSLNNVRLHGAISHEQLAINLNMMDAFLICYDVKKDQSNGTNYHKIMEFLSTGKVIISNNITAYKDQPDLVQMVSDRTDNKKLPELFKKVTSDLSFYNSTKLMEKRKEFARNNTYKIQIKRIEQIIYSNEARG